MADPSAYTPSPTGSPASKGGDYLFSLNRDLKALNASVLVITQKIKFLVRNEKILGRNLIVINKRVRDIQSQVANSEAHGVSDEVRASLQELDKKVGALSQRLIEVEAKVDDLNSRTAKEEEVKELKYIVENINPLHLVTMEQAEQMIEKKNKK